MIDDTHDSQVNKGEEINDIDDFIDENAEEQEHDQIGDHELDDDEFDDLDIINDSKIINYEDLIYISLIQLLIEFLNYI